MRQHRSPRTVRRAACLSCSIPFFLLGQLRSGLTTAMFLFLIASGLSLIFGVLKIINFAHGSLYMIGAYIAWNMTVIRGPDVASASSARLWSRP